MAMKVAPSAPPAPGAHRLGDWSLNLLHTRPKLVAMSEHDRLGLVLEAAPYATLPQRFIEAVFAQLLAIGVPPDVARRERDGRQPLTLTATTPYANRLSLQANLKDYAWLAELMWAERAAGRQYREHQRQAGVPVEVCTQQAGGTVTPARNLKEAKFNPNNPLGCRSSIYRAIVDKNLAINCAPTRGLGSNGLSGFK